MKPLRDTAKRLKLRLPMVAAALVWIALSPSPYGAGDAQEPARPKSVLALHLGGVDNQTNAIFDKNIQAALASAPAGSIEYYAEYLDSDRFAEERLRDYLRQKYGDHRIDVIITLARPTLNFLLKYRSDLFPNTPIVFHAGSRADLAKKDEANGVPVMVDFSGCPGDSPNSTAPNWVTCPWPPDFRKVLDWQWNEVVAPYWTEHARFAADHGVKIAVEMHPGFVAYSPETMLRLRSISGANVGCNYDPSHLFWQGIDPIAAVRVLGEAIFHVHAKDTQLYPTNMVRSGVLDTKPYTDERDRAWIFRTCGYGHGIEFWSELVSTLRMFGYDYAISIEHEDSLLSPGEGLTKAASFLNNIVVREQPAAAWWS